jgi:hypothetical protein
MILAWREYTKQRVGSPQKTSPLLLAGFQRPAQISLVSGALDGSVSDSSGGRIPSVAIIVPDIATHLTRVDSTNAEGSYHVTELPVGIYEVSASQPGFAPYRPTGMLNRRMSKELVFSASYTLSKTFDDASDFDEQPQNPFNLRADWARSLQNQQHRLVFNALWELPIGDEEPGKPAQDNWMMRIFGHIEVAPIFTVESGRPVNPLTGLDSTRSGDFPLSARPLGFGRNSLKSLLLMNTDFRVLKYFPFSQTARLDVVAEAFNLFNRANVARINPVFGVEAVPQPGFLQPLAAAGVRQIQFSLDFEF